MEYVSRDYPSPSEDFIATVTAARQIQLYSEGSYQDVEYSGILPFLERCDTMSGSGRPVSLSYTAVWINPALESLWIGLYNSLRNSTSVQSIKFHLLFSLSAMAYSSKDNRKLIPALLSFASAPIFLRIHPPYHEKYKLKRGFVPTHDQLRTLILSKFKAFEHSPAKDVEVQSGLKTKKAIRRAQQEYYDNQRRLRADMAIEDLLKQWPCTEPSSPFSSEDEEWFSTSETMLLLHDFFESVSHNLELGSYCLNIDEALRGLYIPTTSITGPCRIFYSSRTGAHHGHSAKAISWSTLFSRHCSAPKAYSSACKLTLFQIWSSAPAGHPGNTDETTSVKTLVSEFLDNERQPIFRLYGERLESSRQALRNLQHPVRRINSIDEPLRKLFHDIHDECFNTLSALSKEIVLRLSPTSPTERILCTAGFWPRLHPGIILRCLATTSECTLDSKWSELLSYLAQSVIYYQHSCRLLALAQEPSPEGLSMELENCCFVQEDNVNSDPDWLLIQVRLSLIRGIN